MSHFKINPVTQRRCCSTARLAMTGSFSLAAFLSWKLESVKTACISFAQSPLCLSARAACGGVPFTDSHSVSSGLRYRVITDANAAWEKKRCDPERTGAASERVIVPRRLCLFSAVTWHHQHLETLQSQQLYLQLRNVRHPPSGRGRERRREQSVRETMSFSERILLEAKSAPSNISDFSRYFKLTRKQHFSFSSE